MGMNIYESRNAGEASQIDYFGVARNGGAPSAYTDNPFVLDYNHGVGYDSTGSIPELAETNREGFSMRLICLTLSPGRNHEDGTHHQQGCYCDDFESNT